MTTKRKKIWIAGHNGMVGKALVETFKDNHDIVTISSKELDLRNTDLVNEYVKEIRPDIAILAAARVGGIVANNTYPVDFLSDNLSIASNFVNACHHNDVQNLFNLGSSCIYPKYSEQPITEESLLSGYLETTNQWYAIAKIAAVKSEPSLPSVVVKFSEVHPIKPCVSKGNPLLTSFCIRLSVKSQLTRAFR